MDQDGVIVTTRTANLFCRLMQSTLLIGHVLTHRSINVRIKATDDQRFATRTTTKVLIRQINLALLLNCWTVTNLDLALLVALHHANSPHTRSAHSFQSSNW